MLLCVKAAAAASEASKFDEAEQKLDEAWVKVDKEQNTGDAKEVWHARSREAGMLIPALHMPTSRKLQVPADIRPQD